LTTLLNNSVEKLVTEIPRYIPFKNTTEEGDVVFILNEVNAEQATGNYAQVISFNRDATKKEEWWFVGLAFLTIPVVRYTFALQTPHFTGQEIFTMGGKKVFIKAVDTKSFLTKDFSTDNIKDDAGKTQRAGKPVITLVK
jgi:hypothetical protein